MAELKTTRYSLGYRLWLTFYKINNWYIIRKTRMVLTKTLQHLKISAHYETILQAE